ncbi:MAG: diacylglycerol kinase family protein [Sulfurovum sp.]
MKILSINRELEYKELSITNITESQLTDSLDTSYDYIIISGGDGTIRRVVSILHEQNSIPKIILNPTGSFNVVAKLHRVPKIAKILQALSNGETPQIREHKFYRLNNHIFLFSAGNMGDVQHILISETLRFGILKRGMAKYIITTIFLLPIYFILTPFMLLSKRRFFIFTPFSFIHKFGSFYGQVIDMDIDLDNSYNILELDGDIVLIEESFLEIREVGFLEIVV